MVDTGGVTVTSPVPADDGDPLVDVLVDGNVLEVMTGEAVIGLPLPTGAALAENPPAVTSWWP
jgi:hypothetical protein